MTDPFSVQTLTLVIGRLLPEPHAGLLAGILFGTKASLSRELTDSLIATGTLHIIALSGFNVSIMVGILSDVFIRIFSRRVSSLLILFMLGAFLWFVGVSPSLVRAVIMGSLSLIAIVFGRQLWSLLSLALAVIIMLLLNFGWIGEMSLQLSVLATLGIILFGGKKPIHSSKSSLLSTLLADDLRITLAAQVFTTPLIFFHFHRLSLISPLTNILIGWLMVPLTVLGGLASLLGYFWLPLGVIPAWGSWVLLEYLVRVVSMTAHLPIASVNF